MQPAQSSPDRKHFGAADYRLAEYVDEVFSISEDLLEEIRVRAEAAGLPKIHVSHFDARHLTVLVRAANASKVVEVGTLAGLSGVCLARGLAPGGILYTFEYEPKHAEVARESFEKAGVSDRVQIFVGAAMGNLPKIEHEGPFDVVFIDADKGNYPNYIRWAARNLRIGGLALIDNAFAWGLLAEGEDGLTGEKRAARAAIDDANRYLAQSGHFVATMLPTGEGLAVGVKIA